MARDAIVLVEGKEGKREIPILEFFVGSRKTSLKPDEMVPIIVEVPQPDGPYGARGMSEHTMIPVMPAIANAIANGLGVRIKDAPMTYEKVALRYNSKDFKPEE